MKYEIIDSFLSKNECEDLIDMATDRLQSSTTVNPVSGAYQIDDFRKSDQMFFRIHENPLIANIEKRIAVHTNTPLENGEGLQVVRYQPGGYFKPHWDDFDDKFEGNRTQLQRGGQRIVTFLMYLNDVEEGGETYFHKLDLSVTPKAGRAIVWWNLKEDGTRDESTYHEGKPLISEKKYIATKWIRDKKFT